MKVTVIPVIIGALRIILKDPKETVGIEDLKMIWNHPDHSTAKIGENTEESAGDWENLLSLKLQWKLSSKLQWQQIPENWLQKQSQQLTTPKKNLNFQNWK